MDFVKNAVAVPIDLTPELKVKIKRVCDEYVESCKRNGLSPIESYMALTFITSALEDYMGAETHGAIHLSDKDLKPQS